LSNTRTRAQGYEEKPPGESTDRASAVTPVASPSGVMETEAPPADPVNGPFWNTVIKRWVGRGELDYEIYVRTRELLALQTPIESLSAPDELCFQIVHQTQELWLKLVAYDGVRAAAALDEGDLGRAAACAARMTQVLDALRGNLRILETLTPAAFAVIRRNLGNGSGLESPGYNAVRAAAQAIDAALDRFLARDDVVLEEVYADDAHDVPLRRTCEALVDVDARFQEWLVGHFMLVRRTLGIDKLVSGLDGFPTPMLGARMTQPLFRRLWDVRVALTRAWQREGGHAPGARRATR
jgi:tryptophan 2,3-dioxygenase